MVLLGQKGGLNRTNDANIAVASLLIGRGHRRRRYLPWVPRLSRAAGPRQPIIRGPAARRPAGRSGRHGMIRVPAVLAEVVFGLVNAWVLLIEILR